MEAGPDSKPSATILTHRAFDRPAVENPRRRGRPPGTVSLAMARRARHDAHWFATKFADDPPVGPMAGTKVEPDDSSGCTKLEQAATLPASPAPHEAAVIAAALAILDHRLRTPGATLNSPPDVKAYLRLHLAERDHEVFAVLFLDQQHRAIGFEEMFRGTLAQSTVYPRELARRALQLNAAAVVLAHNHPSGLAEPSKADELLTRALKDALRLVDVVVLDHVVIGGACAVSFAERGLL